MHTLHEFGLFAFIIIVPFLATLLVIAKLLYESKSKKKDKEQT